MTFLSTWTFNLICTLTALAVVWVHEIAAPVSWLLIVPAVAFDIWRLLTPDDFAEGGPHHRFWHNPNAPLWFFGLFCIGVLLLTPLLRYSCFQTINSLIAPYYGLASKQLVQAGGICETRYGNSLYISLSVVPFIIVSLIIYVGYICKRSRSYLSKFQMFGPNTDVEPKIFAILFFSILAFVSFYIGNIVPFDHLGSRPFLPAESIFSYALLLMFNYAFLISVAAGCGYFCYSQLKMEKTNVRSNQHQQ
jgi:hypothetical protein